MKFLGALSVAFIAMTAVACTTVPPEDSFGVKRGALVQYVNYPKIVEQAKSRCAKPTDDERCSHLQDYDIVSTALYRNWTYTLHWGAMVPKSEKIAIDDIIEIETPKRNDRAATFVRVLKRHGDTESACKWKGSKYAFSGGVSCPDSDLESLRQPNDSRR